MIINKSGVWFQGAYFPFEGQHYKGDGEARLITLINRYASPSISTRVDPRFEP